MIDMMTQPRARQGIPTGGQFAASIHDEPGIELGEAEVYGTFVVDHPADDDASGHYRVLSRHITEDPGSPIADGPDGEPAYRQFWHDGTISLEQRSRGVRGEAHDGRGGEPGQVTFGLDGKPSSIVHLAGGRRHDPETGAPSTQHFHANGERSFTQHYRHGQECDAPDGSPGFHQWDDEGRLIETRRCAGTGRRSDGPKGEPAVVTYWRNGRIRTTERYDEEGRRSDGPNGEPAIMSYYDNGKLRHTGRFPRIEHWPRKA